MTMQIRGYVGGWLVGLRDWLAGSWRQVRAWGLAVPGVRCAACACGRCLP